MRLYHSLLFKNGIRRIANRIEHNTISVQYTAHGLRNISVHTTAPNINALVILIFIKISTVDNIILY